MQHTASDRDERKKVKDEGKANEGEGAKVSELVFGVATARHLSHSANILQTTTTFRDSHYPRARHCVTMADQYAPARALEALVTAAALRHLRWEQRMVDAIAEERVQRERTHAQEPHAQGPHAQEPHAQEPHAQEPHAQEPHVQELHAQEPHVQELHAQEPHAQGPHAQGPRAQERTRADDDTDTGHE